MKIKEILEKTKISVLLPITIVLVISFVVIYLNTQRIISNSEINENNIIAKEMYHYLQMQDLALDMLESALDKRMSQKSADIVQYIADSVENVEFADLRIIGNKVGLNNKMEDIYIIDTNGIVINTTFKKDLYINFFDFGEEHKKMLLNVLKGKSILNERFSVEKKTNRIKKYSYQPTIDGKYIVELGAYSDRADMINNTVLNIIEEISQQHHSVVSIELFTGWDNPFSLNKAITLDDKQRKIVVHTMTLQKDTSFIEKVQGIEYTYDYIYMNRENTNLYKNAVIRIVSDKSEQNFKLKMVMLQSVLISMAFLIGIFVLINKKLKNLLLPLENLFENIFKVSHNQKSDDEECLVSSKNYVELVEKINSYIGEVDGKIIRCDKFLSKIDDSNLICSVSDNRIIRFMNANNQVYLIHKPTTDSQADVVLPISDSELQFYAGDILYVFQKSFVEKIDFNNKSLIKNFHSFLLLIQSLPLNEQKQRFCDFLSDAIAIDCKPDEVLIFVTRLS